MKRAGSSADEPQAKKKAGGLSKEQAAVYDRQLRVWGVEAQQRMMQSKILVVGMGGLTCEVCKNLILAGVGKVTLMDHTKVAPADLCSNYFVDESLIGENRATASLAQAAELNPFVSVDALAEDASTKEAAFFGQYNCVVVSNRSTEQQMQINDLCREAKTMFYSCDVFGMCGVIFADLLSEFEFVPDNGKQTSQKLPYVDMRAAFAHAWAGVRAGRPTPPLFVPLAVLNQLRGSTLDWPAAAAAVCKANDAPASSADDSRSALAVAASAEFAPTCAIVGGIAAQEVIKAVTNKGKPFRNQFYFDASDPKTPGIFEMHGAPDVVATKAAFIEEICMSSDDE